MVFKYRCEYLSYSFPSELSNLQTIFNDDLVKTSVITFLCPSLI